jgi:addiction module HigA family antidote
MNNMQMVNKYVPDYLVAPGEILKDYLECSGLTQTSLAERTGLSKKTINEIIKAKSTITAETALKFECTLGRPAHFWSGLERQYQEDKTRLADKIQMESCLHWLDNEIENEANAFARDKLIPSAHLNQFLTSAFQPSLPEIKRFAKSIGIAPDIVVGRLQHDKACSDRVV